MEQPRTQPPHRPRRPPVPAARDGRHPVGPGRHAGGLLQFDLMAAPASCHACGPGHEPPSGCCAEGFAISGIDFWRFRFILSVDAPAKALQVAHAALAAQRLEQAFPVDEGIRETRPRRPRSGVAAGGRVQQPPGRVGQDPHHLVLGVVGDDGLAQPRRAGGAQISRMPSLTGKARTRRWASHSSCAASRASAGAFTSQRLEQEAPRSRSRSWRTPRAAPARGYDGTAAWAERMRAHTSRSSPRESTSVPSRSHRMAAVPGRQEQTVVEAEGRLRHAAAPRLDRLQVPCLGARPALTLSRSLAGSAPWARGMALISAVRPFASAQKSREGQNLCRGHRDHQPLPFRPRRHAAGGARPAAPAGRGRSRRLSRQGPPDHRCRAGARGRGAE